MREFLEMKRGLSYEEKGAENEEETTLERERWESKTRGRE